MYVQINMDVIAGVMCEYDALPGIGHACGHNLIAILGVSVALGIKEALERGDIKGKVSITHIPTLCFLKVLKLLVIQTAICTII